MGIVRAAILALGATGAFATATGLETRQTEVDTIKYCPGSTTVCFSEFVTPSSNIVYRIAIPDVSSAPFDILLQIVAPKSTTGWAGLAWGGGMTSNPLTIGWPSGSSAVVSSRWATSYSLPGAYAGATYTVLPTSTTNSTHWQLDVLCKGCSQWQGLSLNPNGPNTFAWAKGSNAVTSAASNTSSFTRHDDKGVFSHDLSLGKIPTSVFDALVSAASPSSSSSATASSSLSVIQPTTTSATVITPTAITPTVITSVTTLPTSVTTTFSITTVKPTSSITTIVTEPSPPTTLTTWTIGQPIPTVNTPKPSTTTVIAWLPPFRPPFRGPPWRRPPLSEDEEIEE